MQEIHLQVIFKPGTSCESWNIDSIPIFRVTEVDDSFSRTLFRSSPPTVLNARLSMCDLRTMKVRTMKVRTHASKYLFIYRHVLLRNGHSILGNLATLLPLNPSSREQKSLARGMYICTLVRNGFLVYPSTL